MRDMRGRKDLLRNLEKLNASTLVSCKYNLRPVYTSLISRMGNADLVLVIKPINISYARPLAQQTAIKFS